MVVRGLTAGNTAQKAQQLQIQGAFNEQVYVSKLLNTYVFIEKKCFQMTVFEIIYKSFVFCIDFESLRKVCQIHDFIHYRCIMNLVMSTLNYICAAPPPYSPPQPMSY